MYWELHALRSHDTKKLRGSSWDEYKQTADRFPVYGIETSEEGFVADYDRDKDKLSVLTTDSEGWQILDIGLTDVFYIQVENALYGGVNVYGPFVDDVERIASEASQN